MHEVGGHGDDMRPSGPPPADDRLWRHPSELRGAAPAPSATPGYAAPGAGGGAPSGVVVDRRPGRYSLGTVVVAGSMGALAMFATLVATGAVGGTPGSTLVVAASTTTAPRSPAPAGAVSVRYEDAERSTIGAGLVVDPRGDVVTAADLPAELPEGATVSVSTSRGGWTAAEVVGRDPLTGLTVLRPPARLAATTTAASTVSAPALGQTVQLVRPAGQGVGDAEWSTAATRVTSTSATCAACSVDGSPLVGLLVLAVPDVAGSGPLAVAPGTSSVTALVLPTDDDPDDELVYAVPAPVAVSVGRRLGATGSVDHGTLDAAVAEADGRLVVTAPAPTSGLRAGDEVLTVEGRSVRRWTDMIAALLERSPGDEVTVAVVRDGRRRTVVTSVASTQAPAAQPAMAASTVP